MREQNIEGAEQNGVWSFKWNFTELLNRSWILPLLKCFSFRQTRSKFFMAPLRSRSPQSWPSNLYSRHVWIIGFCIIERFNCGSPKQLSLETPNKEFEQKTNTKDTQIIIWQLFNTPNNYLAIILPSQIIILQLFIAFRERQTPFASGFIKPCSHLFRSIVESRRRVPSFVPFRRVVTFEIFKMKFTFNL